jgi:endonuclease/exonuclease/phosphatase family metal-dependent hydrolase
LAKGKKRIIANGSVAAFTLLAYFSTTISPADYWWAGFLALLVPLFIVANFVFLLHWFLQKSPKLLISLAVLILGFPFFKSSINFSFSSAKTRTSKSFTVLSYNVKVFNVYNHLQGKDSINAKNLIQQVVEDSSDIKCLQEFFCEDSSKVFNTIARIAQHKKYFYTITPIKQKRHNYFGLAIFSKYPIIKAGEIPFPQSRNRSHFADIKIGKDTLRVYNVHLQSISLDEEQMFSNESYEQLKKTYGNVFQRMKRGFQRRAKQTDLLIKHIQKSPYPVVICGDFNDTPYSYTYTSFKNNLQNAFEKAGSGFDFSYNGKMFFLRIDNQFFSEKLKIHYFETDRKWSYSDHFPLRATYEIKKNP